MRVAVLIIGLLLGLLLFIQTFVVYVLGSASSSTSSAQAGAVGLLVAVMWLVAAAFVIGVPILSTIVFAVAGVLALAVSGDFRDMAYWGIASFVLAALSFIGLLTRRRGIRVEDRKQRERDARLAAGIRESISTTQLQALPANVVYCAQCGSSIPASSRFCQECGAPRSTDQAVQEIQPPASAWQQMTGKR